MVEGYGGIMGGGFFKSALAIVHNRDLFDLVGGIRIGWRTMDQGFFTVMNLAPC